MAAEQKVQPKPTGAMVTDRSTGSAINHSKASPSNQSAESSGDKPTSVSGSGSNLMGKVDNVVIGSGVTQAMTARYKGAWQMFLQNPCRTGNSYIDIAPATQGKVKWTFPAEGPIDSSPAIYKGVIYVGSDDGHVYAIDETSGRMLWRSKLGDKVKSSPAVEGGVLVVGCEDKKVWGLSSQTGKVLWSFETKDRVSSSPAVHDGVAYVGGWDGILYALEAKTGKLRWQFPAAANHNIEGEKTEATPALAETTRAVPPVESPEPVAKAAASPGIPTSSLGRITSSPCVGPNMVIVTAHNGNVYAVSTHDGSLLWQFRTGGKIMASPMILDNLVYFGSWDHAFYAVDLATGKQRWKTGAAESFSIAATGVGGRIFASNDDLKLYCFDAKTGKVIWKTQINSPVPLLSSSPAIAGNMLYCGSPDSNVYAIDIRNGAIKWKLKTQRPIVSSPAVFGGGVCVGSQDGNLYLIN